MEVLLLLLPQAHPIDDLGEHLEKRLAVWPQEPVSSPTLASFPGSCVGGVKSLVHTVCACSVTPGFLGLWKLADTMPQYHSVYHRIIVCCTRTIEDGGAFRRVWERG